MANGKERIRVTVDAEPLAVARNAVRRGDADSLSAWVNEAMADRVDRDRKLGAGWAAVVAYEAEFGEITEAEMTEQRQADREAAVRVRGRGSL